jgi:hypothetical protein
MEKNTIVKCQNTSDSRQDAKELLDEFFLLYEEKQYSAAITFFKQNLFVKKADEAEIGKKFKNRNYVQQNYQQFLECLYICYCEAGQNKQAGKILQIMSSKQTFNPAGDKEVDERVIQQAKKQIEWWDELQNERKKVEKNELTKKEEEGEIDLGEYCILDCQEGGKYTRKENQNQRGWGTTIIANFF